MNETKTLKPNMVSAFIGEAGISLLIGAAIGFTAAVLGKIIWGVLITLGIGALILTGKMLNMATREYRFDEDHLEFYEGFFNLTQTNIPYNRITDISLEQPINQRPFGTGTIKVNTAGSNTQEIKIAYVDDPEQEYSKIKNITGN